jgi:hypothetical protein
MVPNTKWWRTTAGLLLFGLAFGYVEAAVVIYLDAIYVPLRAYFYPAVPKTELFPLLSIDQLRSLGPEHIARLKIEVGRELATLLTLAGVALGVTRNLREWVAAFLVSFGIWDLAFYVFLKLLANWPASLLTWDLLFLVPAPWVGPVLAPVLVSLSMILAGLTLLWHEYGGRPVQITGLHWSLILLGAVLIVGSFLRDYREVLRGGRPVNEFHWALFSGGLAIGLLAFAVAFRRSD